MKRKSIIMLLCAVIIISSAAFGTIAYLTDRASITNKFTIGNVSITVDETLVDENGEPVPDPEYDPENPTPEHPDENKRTNEGNDYPLTPGAEYEKDPTLTVSKGSKEAYVRMMVTISRAAELKDIFADLQAMYPEKYANGFLPQEHVEGWNSADWICQSMIEDTAANTYLLEFRYKEAVPASDAADTRLPALFTSIKIPRELNYDQLNSISDLTIDVEGHAIQTTAFADANEAWAAFDAQMGTQASQAPQP